MTYTPQSYYPGTPTSHPQSMPARVMAPAPNYPYNFPTTMPGPSVSQLPEGTHLPQPYVGGYGSLAPASQRGDNYYYPQSSISEAPYGHQYMPFPQSPMLQYPDVGQPPSPHPSTDSSTSQRPNSPDRGASDPRSRRIGEVRYDSIAHNYRRIMTTVSQASPSPSTDSSGRSFERPVVDDMLYRAVEGLRHLDPSRAEQYAYPYDQLSEMPSGVVGEAPSETVFVQYYEDGRTEANPTKTKIRVSINPAHEEVINVRVS
ncbi:hypothetical protein FRC10_009090 [Ceratobasidium sp. 414]|nr:hypothetical protein FRC10_009090 [Ceratobasidium sp. 414]